MCEKKETHLTSGIAVTG